ncbi:relaxin-3-like [Hippocampus zosterae]|uniref:relaxin-3-like n=1 Tax=Hippocampus zosterae TaxID=109293 RepID=UPI00223DB015|nr:relaxin-3-like [Hippocampus zosterae]
MFLRLAICVLLSALVVYGDAQPQTISRALLPREYGVKLCGREFIRAVIFTCGGSRWKRLIDADYESFYRSPRGDVTKKSQQLTSHTRNLLPRRTSSTSSVFSPTSLADSLTLRAASSKSDERDTSNVFGALTRARWRRRRRFSQGVAGVCCIEGCTKYDIGGLC